MPDKGKVERPFRYIREDFFLGWTLPPPANSQTPRDNRPNSVRAGEVVAVRSLAFYDAVGKRLAANDAAA